MNPEKKKPLELVVEATKVLAPVAFLYLATWWGFKRDVKEEVWNRLEELNPNTYVNVNKLWRHKHEKKRRR